MKGLTKESFIEKARKIHGDKYDYSKVEYIDNKTKVCIICPIHGEFWQRPDNHLHGAGCYKCGRNIMGKKQTKNTQMFVEEARKVHGDEYDYSKVKYVSCFEKVCIVCKEHGEFWQRPANHLQGQGCPLCSKPIHDTESFVAEARKIHNDKYDYSKVVYERNKKDVCIICSKHGEFWQTPHMHLQGQGCPYCKESKLEKEVEKMLKEDNITFVKQCRNNTLNWLGRLSLDFYLPEYNIAIECQGKQHFRWNSFFGEEEEFEKQIERDNRKATLCFEHGVKLLYYSNPLLKPTYEVVTNRKELIESIKNGNNF